MSLLLAAVAVKKARARRKAACAFGAAFGIAKFATFAALPVAVALGAGAAGRCAARRKTSPENPVEAA